MSIYERESQFLRDSRNSGWSSRQLVDEHDYVVIKSILSNDLVCSTRNNMWLPKDDAEFKRGIRMFGKDWDKIENFLKNKYTKQQLYRRFQSYKVAYRRRYAQFKVS